MIKLDQTIINMFIIQYYSFRLTLGKMETHSVFGISTRCVRGKEDEN